MTVSQDDASSQPPPGIEILTPGEVAALYRVDPKTVTRWADSGRLTSFRTPGGHRRFRAGEVFAHIASTSVNSEGRQ